MKRIVLSLVALASLSAAHAQKMGDFFVNGEISYKRTGSESTAGSLTKDGPVDHNFSFTPSIGYQFDRNWGAGIAFSYKYNRTVTETVNGDEREIGRLLGVGPFIRYTQPLSPMFFLYGQLNALYVNGRDRSEGPGVSVTKYNRNGFDINVMPAVGINLTRSIALTGSFGRLGFATTKEENPNVSNAYLKNNVFEATFGREFALGVQWNFGASARPVRRRMEPMSETRRMDRYRDTDGDTETTDEAPRRRRDRERRDRD